MSPPPVSDTQLIARVVVSDDRHAFSELVRRHQSSVRATLRKLAGGNAALADDLAQEAFLLAYRNLRSFRQDAKFSTWLYRILQRLSGRRAQDQGAADAPGHGRRRPLPPRPPAKALSS